MKKLLLVFAMLFVIPWEGNGGIPPGILEKNPYRARYCLNGEWDILAADSELADFTPL